MSTHAEGTFEVKSWEEKPYEEIEGGAKLTRASVAQSFQDDLEGEGKVEYLMAYSAADTAEFVGLQRLVGRIGGRSGSVVLRITGTFDSAVAKGAWSTVPGAGTGDLRGLHGEGGFAAPHGPRGTTTLNYDFE